MREIILDTETTGLDPRQGNRVVEIGCLELINHVPTGAQYHTYLDPERDMPADAFAVHGLSAAFLTGKPVFAQVVEEFLDFVGDAKLVIHNAEFDLRFLNFELERLGFPTFPSNRSVDTVALARRKFPGAPASLDALCRRFNIDNSARTRHGALLDAELLAEVYLELIGGRQPGLGLVAAASAVVTQTTVVVRPARVHAPTPEELAAHAAFIAGMKEPLWLSA
jgi:DNA polymerase III subunit epsilon